MIYNVTLGANNLLTHLLVIYTMLLYVMMDLEGLMSGLGSLSYVSIACQH